MFSQSHLLLVFNVFMYPVYGTTLLTEQINLFYLTVLLIFKENNTVVTITRVILVVVIFM